MSDLTNRLIRSDEIGKALDHILDLKNPKFSEICLGGGVHSTGAFK